MIDEGQWRAAGGLLGDDRAVGWLGGPVAEAFAAAVGSGRLDVPLPGGGRTGFAHGGADVATGASW
jgi:hypothetical protein